MHRPNTSDVFLSDWEKTGIDRFSVMLRWPKDHAFHTMLHGLDSPTLIAEAIRQAGMLIAHAEYGVPVGHHFLMSHLDYTIEPELLDSGDHTPVRIEVTCTDVRLRGTRLSAMTCHMSFVRDGRVIATGEGSLTCIAPAAYRRLRGEYADATPFLPVPDPVHPALVGRTDPDDVLLAPTKDPSRWILRAPTANKTLFARANDHIPGMVLLEAAHQAVFALAGSIRLYPTSLRLGFDRYAEFDTHCLIEAQPVSKMRPEALSGGDDTICLSITGHQAGRRIFHALLEGIPVSS